PNTAPDPVSQPRRRSTQAPPASTVRRTEPPSGPSTGSSPTSSRDSWTRTLMRHSVSNACSMIKLHRSGRYRGQVVPHLGRRHHLGVAAEAEQDPRRGHPAEPQSYHGPLRVVPAVVVLAVDQMRSADTAEHAEPVAPDPGRHAQRGRPLLDLPPQGLPQLRELHPVP